MPFEKFNYARLEEVIEDALKNGIVLPFAKTVEALKKKVDIAGHSVPNAMAIHPMEGCDGELDGSPGELTVRRYERFSRGGAGLIWFEAVAVRHDGRANPRQLWIHDKNLHSYKKIYDFIIQCAKESNGASFKPLCIMQLTHSGRYSKPEKGPVPILAAYNPYLDKAHNTDPTLPVISDTALESLQQDYVTAAKLAYEAGFEGVDVKACHRYLISEILSSHERNGKYGGSFQNRARFLLEVVDKVKAATHPDFIVTTRLNIYDGIPYPYGFGMKADGSLAMDLTEPLKLVTHLYDKGVRLINLTMGNPYYNPHVNRPYDSGFYVPTEHPLQGIERLVSGIGRIQKAVPGIVIVGTGYSWLRQFSANVGAGVLENGNAQLIGFGRNSFAYPDFARDIIDKDMMVAEKCCITCGKCTEIMRAGGASGCVIRDSSVYAPIYKACTKQH